MSLLRDGSHTISAISPVADNLSRLESNEILLGLAACKRSSKPHDPLSVQSCQLTIGEIGIGGILSRIAAEEGIPAASSSWVLEEVLLEKNGQVIVRINLQPRLVRRPHSKDWVPHHLIVILRRSACDIVFEIEESGVVPGVAN